MSFQNVALNAATNGITAAFPFISLHTADPGTTGTNESSASRRNPSWPAASGSGDSTVTAQNFTGGAVNGACTYVGFWSAVTGGTFGGSSPLSGNQTFDATGAYTIDSLTVNATAT